MIVIVAGLPGSGKTNFAKHLVARLGSNYLNSDQVRLQLQATGKYSMNDKLVVYKEMLLQTTKSLEENRDVVVDATFYHHTMREMFLRLADGYNVPVRVIEITAEEDLIKQRLQTSGAYSQAGYSVYEKVRDDFEEITMPHLTLQSTNDNLNAMLESAMIYINGVPAGDGSGRATQ